MLEIQDLTVTVADKNILNNFNLKLDEGKIHVIMGPNGAGKSSICKVLLDDEDYKIKKGTIKYQNKLINKLSTTDRSRLGIYYLSQSPMAIEGVTNAEMLRMALNEKTNKQVGIFEFNKKLKAICEKLSLPKTFIHKNINEGASGGERKKIELMHLWMLEPNLILLDEIDSGLDVDALKIVVDSINEYYEKYQPTILIITHHIKILDSIKPDKVHVLIKGSIVNEGDVSLAKKIEKEGFNEYIRAFKLSKDDLNE